MGCVSRTIPVSPSIYFNYSVVLFTLIPTYALPLVMIEIVHHMFQLHYHVQSAVSLFLRWGSYIYLFHRHIRFSHTYKVCMSPAKYSSYGSSNKVMQWNNSQFQSETFNDKWWCMYQWHRCRVDLRSSLQGRHRRDHSSSLWVCQNRSQLNNRCRSQQQHMILGERKSFISTAILHMEIKQKKKAAVLY